MDAELIGPFDVVVFGVLGLVYVLSLWQMWHAGRDRGWVIVYGLIFWLFFVAEILAVSSRNTLSDNLVQSIPPWAMDWGTTILYVVLRIHWWDLGRRRHVRCTFWLEDVPQI